MNLIRPYRANPAFLIYLWLILFGVLPMIGIMILSLMTKHADASLGLPLTLIHYQTIFTPMFIHVLVRSLMLGLLTTFLCLIMAYPLSYYMVCSKYSHILLLLMIIPFWTSSLIRTYALLAILKKHGLLYHLLSWLHLSTSTILYTNTAVMIGLVYTLFPFMVLPLYNRMARFNMELFDAARDLGAQPHTLFFRIFLPHTWSAILSGSAFVLLPAMTLFYIPNLLGGARAMVLGNLIQNEFFIAENWPQGAAISMMLTLSLGIIFIRTKRISQSERTHHELV